MASAPVTVVIGPTEAGKSTLIAELARRLAETGSAVGVVDADLGQSEIGPPTTIGLGRAHAGLQRLADAEPIALHFVGATSAARNVLGAVVGVRRMLDRARALGLQHVIVDTGGLIAGDLGRVLKQAKIDVTDADLVICLEARGECEHIVRPYAPLRRPRILRLPTLASPRLRSVEDRRRHRATALARHFQGARSQTLDLSRVVLRRPSRPDGEVIGMLAGLDDVHGQTRGLGVVRAIDLGAREMVVDTAVPADEIVVVTVGTERLEEP